ncbi:MAG: transporter substrate-binding domain-containing protein, partial [Cyanobacteria bacterium P01_G01_bin.49]
MNKTKTVYVALFLVGILIIILLAIRPSFSQEKKQVFKVATEPTFPPFEMLSPDKNTLEGFDIDLMKAIAQEANISVEFESLPFDGIIPALQARTV